MVRCHRIAPSCHGFRFVTFHDDVGVVSTGGRPATGGGCSFPAHSSIRSSIPSSRIDATSEALKAKLVGLRAADEGVDTSLTVATVWLLPSSMPPMSTTGEVALLAGEIAGVGGVSDPISLAQMVRRYSASIGSPYCSAIISQNFGSFCFTSLLSFCLSMLSGLQWTLSGFPPLACGRRGVATAPAPEVAASAGLGSNGLPLILESGLLGVPAFWMAPAALTGEKLVAMKGFVAESGDAAAGLVAGLATGVLDEVDETELFLLRRLPPCES